MHYAFMHRSSSGENTVMKSIARSIEDAKEMVEDALPWLQIDNWVDAEDSSMFELSDGSAWIVYREA